MKLSLVFTQEELTLIGAALAELPYKVSAVLLSNIQAQINVAQSNAAAKADREPKE